MKPIIVIALLALPAIAQAQVSLGVEGGLMAADGSHTSAAWGVRGGVDVAGPIRLEARYLSTSPDTMASVGEFGGQVRVALLPIGLTPYGFGGIAKRWSGDEGAWMAPVGGGLDLPIAPFLRLAPELTWHFLLGNPQLQPALARDSWNASLVLRLDL